MLSLGLGLALGGVAQAQAASPTRIPISLVSFIDVGGAAVLFAIWFPTPPTQTGRCRPLLADGTLGPALQASNPPTIFGLTLGQPYTCELEFTTAGGNTYLGQASSLINILPDPGAGVTAPTNADAVTGLAAGSATSHSLSLAFTPSATPSTTYDGYTAVCIETPSSNRYVAVRGAGSPITVDGLLPNQNYLCSVQPYNTADITIGTTTTFTTLAAPPSPQPVAVPALSGAGLALLALLTALAAPGMAFSRRVFGRSSAK